MKPARLSLLLFAASGCATSPPGADSPLRDGIASAPLGGIAAFFDLDVKPLKVEEDSRCPSDVQCIQAGTVRLAVRIEDRVGTSDRVLTLREPIALNQGGWLGLTQVCPHKSQSGSIAPGAYMFTFSYRVDAPPAPIDLPCE